VDTTKKYKMQNNNNEINNFHSQQTILVIIQIKMMTAMKMFIQENSNKIDPKIYTVENNHGAIHKIGERHQPRNCLNPQMPLPVSSFYPYVKI